MPFVVRALPATGLDGAFRIHLPQDQLEHLGLKIGDHCDITGEDGTTVGQAIAWRATDKMGSNPKVKPVKMTEMLRTTFGIDEGSHVSLSKSTTKTVLLAEKINLVDVTPKEYIPAHESEMEDGRWRSRCISMFTDCEALASGMTFDVSAKKKGLRKRFYVESIGPRSPSDVHGLYHHNDNTQIMITDRNSTNGCSNESLESNTSLIVDYVGGLAAQVEELNQQMRRLCKDLNGEHKRHVLLHGFEGTGKSLLLKKMKQTSLVKTFCVNEESLTGATTAKNRDIIRATFRDARASQPSLVLMDKIDALAPATEKAYAGFIAGELDELKKSRVLVVAACRSPREVHSDLLQPGRLAAQIELHIPDIKAREEILNVYLGHSGENALKLSQRTHGFTGRDIEMLVDEARYIALNRKEKEESSGQPVAGEATVTTENHLDGHVENGHATAIADADDSVVLTVEDFDAALTKVKPTALKEIMFELPQVRWEHIGGSSDMKKRFDNILWWPQQYPQIMARRNQRPKKGVLLYGPPGCSKTLTAQAVASKYNYNFIPIKGAELISMYVGESERKVREVFSSARKASPCVIFFDEIDSIASERESTGSKGLNVLTTLLNEMDGFDALKNVFVLAATNKPGLLDPAIMRPGRFDSHIYVGPPNEAARMEILEIKLRGLAMDENVDLERLVSDTQGYSGAEVVQICELANDDGRGRDIELFNAKSNAKSNAHPNTFGNVSAVEDPPMSPLTRRDFDNALEKVQKGITAEMIRTYEAFGTE